MAGILACAAGRQDLSARRILRALPTTPSWGRPTVPSSKNCRSLGIVRGPKSRPSNSVRPRLMTRPTLAAQARELVRLKVDVLVALGGETALKAAAAASHTIPIVFVANNYDPITLGYARSLAKPGGNVTGIFLRQTELAEKQVELLMEAVPDRKRLAVLWDAISADQFAAAEQRARALGLQVRSLKMEKPPYDLDAAFRRMTEAGSQMLLALTSQFFAPAKRTTCRSWPPVIGCLPCSSSRPGRAGGGLMSYGADNVAMYRQARRSRRQDPARRQIRQTCRSNCRPSSSSPSISRPPRRVGIELPTSILLRANDVIE